LTLCAAALIPATVARVEPQSGISIKRFDFERVRNLTPVQAPAPHDTLLITATIPYNGEFGTGEAYVYLSDVNSTLSNPVIVVEGFDINNDMNWNELYEFLNQEGLIETLRSIGFDAVVLNFTESTDYLQRNAFVVVELLQQVQAAIDPGRDFVLAGASMGGLCARYALAYMESNALDHRVRTFVSFDAPHGGANIPLGIQYWLDFFSGQSPDAAYNLERLDTPAARQMLVYHHTDPPGTTGESDPLRAAFLADMAAVGDWPSGPRLVAVANGSSLGVNQGYAAGTQFVDYEYSDLLTTIRGNIWAVPDGVSQMIFDGYIRIIIIPTTLQVTVSGTKPYDSAPGGFRNTMADMDSITAPYGDIVALHPSHCFVPTVSSLALDTQDLFYDIAGDPDLLAHTPFDVVYYPAANEEHGTITPESAQWFLTEVRWASTAVGPEAPVAQDVVLHQNVPNPFNPSTTIRFALPDDRHVRLSVYDVTGRRIATLVDGLMTSGEKRIEWNGRDDAGSEASSGVYFYRLVAGERVSVRKMVLIR
jgi:pimeloyl-ACP methyl ester carboxylesterase